MQQRVCRGRSAAVSDSAAFRPAVGASGLRDPVSTSIAELPGKRYA